MKHSNSSLSIPIGVVVFSNPLEVGADRANQIVLDVISRLESLGYEIRNVGIVDTPARAVQAGRRLAESHVCATVAVGVSWYEDYLVLDLLEECQAPFLLWSLPGMETGSLCGMQQLTYTLRELGVPFQAIFGAVPDPRLETKINQYLQAAMLRYRLRRARIGRAGEHVPGMNDAAVNELALKRTIGPRVVPVDVTSLLKRTETISEESAQAAWSTLTSQVGRCGVPDGDGIVSMKVLAAFEEQIEQLELDAVAVGCYPHLMGRVCLAASVLADRGIPLACEGDVNGAVGQLILGMLTGSPTHNTDWLEPLEDGTVILSHCGNGSFDLAESRQQIELAPVRLMNQGACVLFPAKPGPVTLLNLVPHGSGYQLTLLEGEAVPTTMVFPGNPLRVRFDMPIDSILDWIHEEGVGHHWIAGYGHVAPIVRLWAEKLAHPDLRLCLP